MQKLDIQIWHIGYHIWEVAPTTAQPEPNLDEWYRVRWQFPCAAILLSIVSFSKAQVNSNIAFARHPSAERANLSTGESIHHSHSD